MEFSCKRGGISRWSANSLKNSFSFYFLFLFSFFFFFFVILVVSFLNVILSFSIWFMSTFTQSHGVILDCMTLFLSFFFFFIAGFFHTHWYILKGSTEWMRVILFSSLPSPPANKQCSWAITVESASLNTATGWLQTEYYWYLSSEP